MAKWAGLKNFKELSDDVNLLYRLKQADEEKPIKWTGEQWLCAHIILRGIYDLTAMSDGGGMTFIGLRRHAVAWFLNDQLIVDNKGFTFEACCEAIEVCPKELRALLVERKALTWANADGMLNGSAPDRAMAGVYCHGSHNGKAYSKRGYNGL